MKKKNKQPNIKFAVLAIDVVIMRIINEELCVLLQEINSPPFYMNQFGVIGGLIHKEETAEQAVGRHLREKSGINSIYKEQLYTFSEIDRDKRGRVVSVAYLALTNKDSRNLKKTSVKTQWTNINKLPKKLAYDHNKIIETAIQRLRDKILYTDIIQYLITSEFTLTELQTAFEIILEKKLDKRNFRKKILKMNLVKKTGKKKYGEAARPAELFKFTNKKIKTTNVII